MKLQNLILIGCWVLGSSITAGNIVFISQPRDTAVLEGKDAFFPCVYTGSSSQPIWIISGVGSPSSNLPSKHFYNTTGLIVDNVAASMDGTSYVCALFTNEYFPSTTGILHICECASVKDFAYAIRMTLCDKFTCIQVFMIIIQ